MPDDDEMVDIPRMSMSHPASEQRRVSSEMMRMRDAAKHGDEDELRSAVKEYVQRWG